MPEMYRLCRPLICKPSPLFTHNTESSLFIFCLENFLFPELKYFMWETEKLPGLLHLAVKSIVLIGAIPVGYNSRKFNLGAA